jgi:bifunctional non-homologous end joining protein LigD
MADDSPKRYTANLSKARRQGKIFVDYLRNQRGATAIAPYSSRGKASATFALPVAWRALPKLKNAHPVAIGDKLARTDPWAGYFEVRQALPRLKPASAPRIDTSR